MQVLKGASEDNGLKILRVIMHRLGRKENLTTFWFITKSTGLRQDFGCVSQIHRKSIDSEWD